MFEGVDQYEATLQPDGSFVIPRLLLEQLRRKPGQQQLLEATDDGILIIEAGPVP